jgi:hypothetical protein
MASFNRYNNRSLSQLLQESAAILDEEFPPGGAGAGADAPPSAPGDELPPDTGSVDDGAPPEEGEGAEDTPEGICNQIRDLLDRLCAKVGVGEEETPSDIPSGPEPTDAAPPPPSGAPPPPMESRKRTAELAAKAIARK